MRIRLHSDERRAPRVRIRVGVVARLFFSCVFISDLTEAAVRLCYHLKTRAIRCTAGIPDTESGTRRRRRSLRVLVSVPAVKTPRSRRGVVAVCASPIEILHPSSFPGWPTRQSRAVYKKSFIRHASSPNSSWKSFRLWMMSPASARCASLDPTALRLGTRQFLLFMYSCSARARRVSDEGRKRKVRKKRVTFPRHDVSGGLGRRVGSRVVPRRSPRFLLSLCGRADAPLRRR